MANLSQNTGHLVDQPAAQTEPRPSPCSCYRRRTALAPAQLAARSVSAWLDALAGHVARLTLPHAGVEQQGERGRVAQYALAVEDGRIVAVQYRCSTCAPLLAYCECLAELLRGRPLDSTAELTAQMVDELVVGVHPSQRVNLRTAYLAALDALRAAAREPRSH